MRVSWLCRYQVLAAPEVLNGPGYSTKADIFSVGIILYTILTGVSPFYGKTQQEVLQKNKACSIEYPDKYWSNVSLSAKSLVEKMTEKNPYKRPTATECLQHQWFNVPSIPHFGSLLAVQENIKLMQPMYAF
jgi:serine/threonine protein kinase